MPALGAGAEGADLSEADEPRGWNTGGPLGFAEGAVTRGPVLEPQAHRPLRHLPLPGLTPLT